MAELQEERTYPGKTAKDCYQGVLLALPKAGFKVWKQRDFGWFVIARRIVAGVEITSSILASPGSPPSLKINLTAKGFRQDQLRPYADELLSCVDAILSG